MPHSLILTHAELISVIALLPDPHEWPCRVIVMPCLTPSGMTSINFKCVDNLRPQRDVIGRSTGRYSLEKYWSLTSDIAIRAASSEERFRIRESGYVELPRVDYVFRPVIQKETKCGD